MGVSELDYQLTAVNNRPELLKDADAFMYKLFGRLRYPQYSIKRYLKTASDIDSESKALSEKTDTWMRYKLSEQKKVFRRNRRDVKRENIENALVVLQESFNRVMGLRPYTVQIAGAMVLFDGYIAEMATGEGKTITASLTAVMQGWRGKPCHVITANDYLAERDSEYLKPFYDYCGISSGCVTSEMKPPMRKKGYSNDVVYTTAKEVTADFLRDRIALGELQDFHKSIVKSFFNKEKKKDETVMQGIHTAIVDEADNILIDEAVTPLIISKKQENQPFEEACRYAYRLSTELKKDTDYRLDLEYKEIEFLKDMEELLKEHKKLDNKYLHTSGFGIELVRQALNAKEFFIRDKHYVVEDEKVIIVDESTGRKMPQRSWSAGLHQMVEAKEGLELTPLNETLARLSFQRFFRFFSNFCGMTGTAKEAAPEFFHIYDTPVLSVPYNRKNKQVIHPVLVYRNAERKWNSIIEDITEVNKEGRPVLVGTRNIDSSEYLYERLKALGLESKVVNAVRHKQEAEVIKRAGERGAVTVATNMAGRGTDIKISEEVNRLGGLHVIATECHESKRIDRQLFGRSGRQGNNGSARAYASMDDELLTRYLPVWGRKLLELFLYADSYINHRAAGIFVKLAQFTAQRRAYKSRCSVQNMDTWLDDSLSFSSDSVDRQG